MPRREIWVADLDAFVAHLVGREVVRMQLVAVGGQIIFEHLVHGTDFHARASLKLRPRPAVGRRDEPRWDTRISWGPHGQTQHELVTIKGWLRISLYHTPS